MAAVLGDASGLDKVPVRLRVARQLLARVGQTRHVAAICQQVADALVSAFADAVVVEVVDSIIRGEDPPPAPLGRGVPLRHAGRRYRGDEAKAHVRRPGEVYTLPFPGPYAQVLTDLKPRVVDLAHDPHWLAAAGPEHAAAIRRCGAQTLFAIPLTLRGTVLGLLSLYRTGQAGSFDQDDVDFGVTLATVVAVSIDNARLYTREHTIAATVQHRLLPLRPCSKSGIETGCGNVPGEAGGGGWCDAFTVACARTVLVAGEVSGQGIEAAATMGELRTVIRSLSRFDLEPDELLARLNETVVLLAAERAASPGSDLFDREPLTASCVYAIYDALAQTCTYARAHYPAPFIVSPGGTPAELPDVPPGPLLGTTDGLPFTSVTVSLDAGSILAFYTPSILPAAPSGGGDPGGPELLRQVLADTGRPLQDMCDEVVYSLPGDARPGDAGICFARVHVFPPDLVGRWRFGRDPRAARKARAEARRKLAAWHVDEETAQATELVVDELVTNAVRYGDPPMWLRIIKDLTISCEVHDASPVTPRLRHPGTLDELGRGLLIVGRLVEAWGTHSTPDGKTVWAEVALPSHPGGC